MVAYAFWSIFFEQNCQRPNDEIRIFPVEKSYACIYNEYFEPWFDRQVKAGHRIESDKPCVSYFTSIRRHPDFKDVKNRSKHRHARCQTCAELRAQMLRSFADGREEEKYIRARRIHDEEVHNWRRYEAVLDARALQSNGAHAVIKMDATPKIGFPHLGQRGIKNLGHERFDLVPTLFDDVSGNHREYVYTHADAQKKDVNLLITELHVMIRRLKSNYKSSQHRARSLTIVADSASENKNNFLFAYLVNVVQAGWFDEIELVYGPVGHTHNGVDACHKIHNEDTGRYFAADIGAYVSNYKKAYTRRIPKASFLGTVINWKEYFKDCLKTISGFARTRDEHKTTVRGFRVAKNKTGTVELTWKMDPASEDKWRGAGGFPANETTPGFFLMKHKPTSWPEIIMPWTAITPPKKPNATASQKKSAPRSQDEIKAARASLNTDVWTRLLSKLGGEDCVPSLEWNITGMETGFLQVSDSDWKDSPEDNIPMGQTGR